MKEAILWRKLNGNLVECNLCYRKCKIPNNSLGFCLVRKNINGKLYSLNYGKIIAEHVDPIEKKPLFHFLPGTFAYSIACPGCNFACAFCQNWEISQVFRDKNLNIIAGRDKKPEEIVDQALKYGYKVISYTYTEPTIFFEFAYDTAKLAVKKGLKNTFVTNGYMTTEALSKIAKYLHACTVDFKGAGNKELHIKHMLVPEISPVFDTLLEMKKKKIHIEITNLVIPKIGDNAKELERLVKWIADNLSPNVPFHLLRFFPHYKLSDLPPTPLETLEKLYNIAKKHLNYVYIGNVPGFKENSYCHECNSLLIERFVYNIRIVNLEKNRCKVCGAKLPFVFS